MTKLLENIYRCVNIALVNELKLLRLRMGLDIWEVIGAASPNHLASNRFIRGRAWADIAFPLILFISHGKPRSMTSILGSLSWPERSTEHAVSRCHIDSGGAEYAAQDGAERSQHPDFWRGV